MIRILTATLLLAILIQTPTNAEQSSAGEYRRIFASENFYLEYRDDNLLKVLAASDGKRLERSDYVTPGWVQFFNPLGSLFGGNGIKYPEVMHKNGTYYQFLDNDRAIALEDYKLNDENLDPRQGWGDLDQKLSVPFELAVFCWNDPYRKRSNAIEKPKFISSRKQSVGKKELDCDRYESAIKNKSGSNSARIVYEMLYDQGQLIEARLSIERAGIEYPVSRLKIKTLSGNVPKDAFKISRKTKIYAAGLGDQSDLLEQPPQIAAMEEL